MRNYTILHNYSYLIISLYLNTVIRFQVFSSNTNNMQATTWSEVTNDNNP